MEPKEEKTIRVVHGKKEPYTVYIGRPSKWGNPFAIGQDGTREEILERYEAYIRGNKVLWAALDELEGQVLGCWCKPIPCHGDILVKLLAEKRTQRMANE